MRSGTGETSSDVGIVHGSRASRRAIDHSMLCFKEACSMKLTQKVIVHAVNQEELGAASNGKLGAAPIFVGKT